MKTPSRFKQAGIFIIVSLLFTTNSLTALAAKFTSPEGNFSINFHDTPVEKSREVRAADGLATTHTFTYKSDENITFSIGYTDLHEKPASKKDAQKMLKEAQEGALSMFSDLVKVTKEKKVSYKKHPGLFYKASGGGLHISIYIAVQSYLIEKRLYQIVVIKYNEPLKLGEINPFIKSFRLLDR